jgi:outer membrane protein OmpA-like peptidoglycan-associated protein
MEAKTCVLAAVLATGAMAANLNTAGLPGVHTTFSAYSLGTGSWQSGLTLDGQYGHEALHEYTGGGLSQLNSFMIYSLVPYAAVGATNWMDLALALPVYHDDIPGLSEERTGIGDLEGYLKLMHPGLKADAPLRLAYIMRGTVRTGDFGQGFFPRDPGYSYVSRTNEGGAFTSGGYNLDPTLAWTLDLRRLDKPMRFLTHLNLGMDVTFYATEKENIPQENTAVHAALALEFPVSHTFSWFVDFYGKTRLESITTGPFLEIFAKDQLNLGLGATKIFASGLSASLSAYGSLGTQENFTRWTFTRSGTAYDYGTQPTASAGFALTLGWGGIGRKADSDFDDNPNYTDKCPQDAEDYDGYEDEDGCVDKVHTLSQPVVHWDTVVVMKRDTVQVIQKDTVRIQVADTLAYASRIDPNQIFPHGKTTFPAITFKTGSDELSRSSFKTLNDIAQSMKNFPEVSLRILGFTDNTGSDATNQALSQRRAEAVVNYLAGQGVDRVRLQALGMGSAEPVGSNKTGQGRMLNRRVEFRRWK